MNAFQQMLRLYGLAWAQREAGRRPGLDDVPVPPAWRRATRRQTLASLREENQRLEALNQAKSGLFAAAIHDLRQPLQALVLFSDALAQDDQVPEQARAVAQMRHSIDSLNRLCAGLLDLTQIDAGQLLPKCADTALAPLFDELQHNFGAVAQAQGLRLVVRRTTACVRGDSMMLTRIFNNLVCNALRHTERGGVLVGARPHRGDIRIDVYDTGVGIAPQHQARVFDAFYQVDADAQEKQRQCEPQGLGLGLATVRRLAQMQGASVALRSVPGRGTRISLYFPTGSFPSRL